MVRSRVRAALLRVMMVIALLPALGGAGTLMTSGLAATSTASGLVAAYSFDEGSGSTAGDASGSGNTGTVSGATWTAAGKDAGALSFDGSSSYVTVPESSSLDLSTAMTLEAWVDPTTTQSGYGAVIAKERTGGGLPYGIESSGGTPDGYVNTGTRTPVAASSSLPVGSWTHLALTYDGSTVRFYVNAVQTASAPASGTIVRSADALRIGADLTWGEYFVGKIDDVRVYNRALSAAEVQSDMSTAVSTPSLAPVAAYAFDEGSGASAGDASGTGNSGTVTNATWTSAGKNGGALSFTGSSSYVTVADSASLDLSSGATLEAWVYPTRSTGFQTIIAKERAGGGFPYGLELSGSVPDGYVNTGVNSTATSSAPLPLNTWTHLAITYDGGAVRLYVNGTQVASVAASGTLVNSASPLRIGADLTWGEYFVGKIDDVRVYANALSAVQIQSDMATPVAGGPPPPPPDTQPPSTPTGLTKTAATTSSISIGWNASTDNIGVAGYGVYRDGSNVGSTSSQSYIFAGLTCGTSYTLAVDAYDAAGNRSAKSSLTASTSSCAPPPSPPQNTSPPTISGNAVEGQVLTANEGSWTGSPSFGYEWRACDTSGAGCGAIAGATARSYTLSAAEVGRTVRVAVTGTNAFGATTAASAPTAVVQAAPSGSFDLLTMTGDQLYTAPGNPWNTPIPGGAAVDPNSSIDVSAFAEAVAGGGGLVISVKRWTVPVYKATSSSPRYDVQLTASWRVANVMRSVPIPPEAAPDPAGDGHMAVFEPATGCEYDFWRAQKTATGWSSSWANSLKFDSSGNGVFPKGLSARGSGFATTAGLIWPQELAQGEIRHALIFSMGATKSGGPVAPATESDGQTATSSAIPEGARLQLDPSLNLDALGLTGYERTIAVALQRYGMYLGDTGSPPSLYAVNPQSYGSTNAYASTWGDQDYVYLKKIPADRFRVLALPPQQPSSSQFVDEGCAKLG